MKRFSIKQLSLPGLCQISRVRLEDQRGYLERLFCKEELVEAGWTQEIAQINHTFTRKAGTVRGLHFQHPPHSEYKLVTCLRGEILDVVVDIRKNSPTRFEWQSIELSGNNPVSILIPAGFAHGFQALTDNVEMLYYHSAIYSAEHEAGINIYDKQLSIQWPRPITEISPRDASFPPISPEFPCINI